MKKVVSILVALLIVSSLLVSACAEETVRIGYCVNFMSHEWYQNICLGAQVRADELGVELLLADANNDASTQISMCENLLASDIDVLCITPVDANVLGSIISQANEMGIPVITESNVVEGAVTYVGISNYTGGYLAGEWLVNYCSENEFVPKLLIVGVPSLEDCRNRVAGFKAALEDSGIEYAIAQEIDGEGLKEVVVERSTDALTAHPDINCVFGINDDSATGAMQAYKAAGLDESALVAIGFGFEGQVGQQALLSDGPYKAALAMFPNYVGVGLIDASMKVVAGEEMPEHYETPIVVITEENFETYYDANEDGSYSIDFEAVRSLEEAAD